MKPRGERREEEREERGIYIDGVFRAVRATSYRREGRRVCARPPGRRERREERARAPA